MATTPLSLEQFGKTIKAKHPEYADIPDAELANKVIAKYPQYKDMVQAPSAMDAQLPNGTMGAQPTRNATQYLQDAERDLTEGGNRTIVGKALGYMQGQGDKGYAGLQSGVSPETAQFMGSVPLGATKMAIGATQGPIKGAPKMAEGALQAATIPLSFTAPEASEAAGSVASKLADKVNPGAIKEAAGGLLQSVAHDANKIPVQLQNAGDAALQLMDWQKKTQLGPTVNKFLNRITNPKQGALTYEEARDFYQLLGKLSVEETNRLAPPVRRSLTQMVVGLKQDIGDAADQVGRAADYYKGLGDYAKGARLQDWYDTAKKYAWNVGLGALGAGGVATAVKFFKEGSNK